MPTNLNDNDTRPNIHHAQLPLPLPLPLPTLPAPNSQHTYTNQPPQCCRCCDTLSAGGNVSPHGGKDNGGQGREGGGAVGWLRLKLTALR